MKQALHLFSCQRAHLDVFLLLLHPGIVADVQDHISSMPGTATSLAMLLKVCHQAYGAALCSVAILLQQSRETVLADEAARPQAVPLPNLVHSAHSAGKRTS